MSHLLFFRIPPDICITPRRGETSTRTRKGIDLRAVLKGFVREGIRSHSQPFQDSLDLRMNSRHSPEEQCRLYHGNFC